MELPDWLRGIVLLGRDGLEYRVVGVDADGYLGVILKAAAEVTIPGDVNVTQEDSIREMQGAEGATLRTVAVDANGQIIMVPRGATGNYLGVDADGFMSAVMKGTYGGVLKTLAADDDGNLIALLTDKGDQWGEKVPVGIGELAARLGSPVSWERRGQVAQIVTFANGFGHMSRGASIGGGVSALCPTVFQSDGYSCELTTGTGGTQSAIITTSGDYSPADRVGFEVAFSLTTQPATIYFMLTVWDGTNVNHAYARINEATNKVQVKNSALVYVDAGDFVPVPLLGLFYSVRLVVDLATKRYVRLLVTGTEYDLSDIACWSGADASGPAFSFSVWPVHDAAVNTTMYLDRMIITTNEP